MREALKKKNNQGRVLPCGEYSDRVSQSLIYAPMPAPVAVFSSYCPSDNVIILSGPPEMASVKCIDLCLTTENVKNEFALRNSLCCWRGGGGEGRRNTGTGRTEPS